MNNDDPRVSPDYQYDDINPQVETAFEYFALISGPAPGARVAAAPLNPNIADSDGLVSYIVASANKPPKHMQSLYDEIRPVMEGLTNVVVSAVIKKAGAVTAKKHDPATWRDPMQAMMKAFCSGFSQTTRSYDQRVRGVEVATKIINILIEAVVSHGAALADFTKFLESQGKTINGALSKEKSSYLYAAVSIVHEIFETAAGTWVYVPKFKSYFTQFTQETRKITTSCASAADFRFKFDLDIMTGAFMVSSWTSVPSFRQSVEDFIARFQQTNIKDSTNYFDSIFESSLAPRR